MFYVTITMSHNASFSHTFEWLDAFGAPVSLAGKTLRLQIKKKATDSSPVLELSTANGRLIIDGASQNRLTMSIPALSLKPTPRVQEGANADDPYLFDMLDIISATERPLMWRGEIHVARGITL